MKRLFQGLNFYFYPNPAINKVNSFKAKLCKRYGAEISPELNESCTHILVSPSSANTEFFDALVKSNVKTESIITNEWCSACIENQKLTDIKDFLIPKPSRATAKRENAVQPESLQSESPKRVRISNNVSKEERHIEPDDKSQIVNLFATVYGIGKYKALKLYQDGHRSLEDIYDHVGVNGRVYIDHYDDFICRIPRPEVKRHYDAVRDLAVDVDPNAYLECMGSYRRGAENCGDIDIILTKRDAKFDDLVPIFKGLLHKMEHTGLALYTFTSGTNKWLGATQVNGIWRRMDILIVPWIEIGAARLYYTGSGEFNREMRIRAIQKSMRLNHLGLFKVRENGKLKILESFSEQRIFSLLDYPWVEPANRKPRFSATSSN